MFYKSKHYANIRHDLFPFDYLAHGAQWMLWMTAIHCIVSFDKCYHSKRYLPFQGGKSDIIGKENLITKVILFNNQLNNQTALFISIVRYHGAGILSVTSNCSGMIL